MTPDPAIRLSSMIRAMEELIAPAITDANPLAKEQAALVVGQLRLFERQWPYFGAYAARCLSDSIDQARALLDVVGTKPSLSAARAAVEATVEKGRLPAPAFATDYEKARNRVAEATAALIEAVVEDGDEPLWQGTSAIVLAHGRKEHLRDRSWFAATGMDPQPDVLAPIADILRQPSSTLAEQVA